ncbi:hypothetical protein [Coraliomargarita sinensis]|nr:hypothetical protein [Coraliomargarita sinensis]
MLYQQGAEAGPARTRNIIRECCAVRNLAERWYRLGNDTFYGE